MSLDQTFLKIFDEEGFSAKKSKEGEDHSQEDHSRIHFSLRVDMKPSSRSIGSGDREESSKTRDIFSFEDEARLRFPNSADFEDEGGFVYFGDSEDADDDPDAFTVVPEPSAQFRQKYADKKRRGGLPPFLLNRESSEAESPVISLFGNGRPGSFTGGTARGTSEDRAILRMDDASMDLSRPCAEKSEADDEETAEKRNEFRASRTESAANKISVKSEGIKNAPSSDSIRSFIDAPGAETLLDSAVSCFLGDWPKPFKKLQERGAREFSLLTDAVVESMFRGNKILGFGGWGRQTGVSTLLLGVAGEMTARRFSVLIVDADFQRPQLGEMLGLNVTCGWENLLRYPEASSQSGLLRIEISDSARFRPDRNPAGDGGDVRRGHSFHLLPLVPEKATEAVAASCKKIWFRTLLELAELFDLVLIDHGSLRTDNDREKVAELLRFGCDGYYLVADRRSASEWESSKLTALSEERRLPCLGIIENFT